jgi:hypothetical protein
MDSEKQVEAYLRRRVTAAGGVARKWVSPGHNGVPDRLVFLPGGKIYPVEMKAPGRKANLSPGQRVEHTRLARLGAPVWVLSTRAEVDAFLREVLE